ncbi:MAG TPA: hypothetical protein VML75_08090 [Kofleriaceae bacterium]|nr:hypothetical protein [Kofleriaceae bacterium]
MMLTRAGMVALLSLGACAGGQRHQTHVASYGNGAPRWQAELVDGVPDGVSTTWHENGQLATRGRYLQGKRDGEFVFWDETGAELRRERYANGALLETSAALGGTAPGQSGGPSTVEATVAIAPPAPDEYIELRFATGMGGTNGAVRTDSRGSDSDGAESTISLGLSVLARRKSLIYGATTQVGSSIFGAGHTYVGGVFGLASPGSGAHVELLAEGGAHIVSGLGNDLFSTTSGETSATLPYLGSQVRLSLDPGDPKHLVFDLAVTGRVDLLTAEREVMTTSCFFGCSSQRETWRAGGQSIDVTLGLSYQFD